MAARARVRRGALRPKQPPAKAGETHRCGLVAFVRYEREGSGKIVHVDVKKVAAAVDDFSRVAYAELLPDERKGACAAFMSRACASSKAWACGSSA